MQMDNLFLVENELIDLSEALPSASEMYDRGQVAAKAYQQTHAERTRIRARIHEIDAQIRDLFHASAESGQSGGHPETNAKIDRLKQEREQLKARERQLPVHGV